MSDWTGPSMSYGRNGAVWALTDLRPGVSVMSAPLGVDESALHASGDHDDLTGDVSGERVGSEDDDLRGDVLGCRDLA